MHASDERGAHYETQEQHAQISTPARQPAYFTLCKKQQHIAKGTAIVTMEYSLFHHYIM